MEFNINYKRSSDLKYIISNLKNINNFIKYYLDNDLKFNKKQFLFLIEVNKVLEENKNSFRESKNIILLRSNLELAILKQKTNSNYFYRTYKILLKNEVDDTDIIRVSRLFNNEGVEYIFKRLLLKANNIYSFSPNTINIIRKYVNDDFLDYCFKELGEKKSKILIDSLDEVSKNNMVISIDIKNNLIELHNIL